MRNNVSSPCRSMALSAARARSRFALLILLLAIPVFCVAQPEGDGAPQNTAIVAKIEAAKSGSVSLDELAEAVVQEGTVTGSVEPAVVTLFEEIPGFEQLLAESVSRALTADQFEVDAPKIRNIKSLIEAAFAESTEQRGVLLRLVQVVLDAGALAKAGDVNGLKALAQEATTSSQKAAVRRYLLSIEKTEVTNEVAPGDDEPSEPAEPSEAVTGAAESELTVYEQILQIARGEGGTAKDRLIQFGKVLTLLSDGLAEGELKREGWPFDDPAVRKAIHSLVGTNITLQQRLVEVYEEHIMFLVRADDGEHLRTFYNSVLELRPDPNDLNNRLRLKIAFKASGDNARHFAIGRLEELKQSTGISLLNRFRLVLKGYYGSAQPIVVLTMVCLLAFGLFLKLFRWSGAVKDTHNKYKRAKAFEEDNLRQTEEFVREKQRASRPLLGSQGPRKFRDPSQDEKAEDKRGPGYFRPVDSQDEYSRLLSFFNLDDEATEADIKAAYRDMVKLHHPDRNPEGEKEQIEAFFQEIKERYDRIMEIRGSWFGKGR